MEWNDMLGLSASVLELGTRLEDYLTIPFWKFLTATLCTKCYLSIKAYSMLKLIWTLDTETLGNSVYVTITLSKFDAR